MILPENKKVWVCGIACGAVILVEAIVLVAGGIELSARKNGLAHSYRQLSQLQNRRPFPSVQNTKKLEDNLDAIVFNSGERLAELKGDSFPWSNIDAAAFSARAQESIERFQAKAAKTGVILPATFEAGFAQYASGGAVPAGRFVPRLSRQLYSVELVAAALIQSGVISIDTFKRDLFESAGLDRPPAVDRRRSLRRSPSSERLHPDFPNASVVGPESHYYIERIAVLFTAKETEVWTVIKGLAEASPVMVVSEFSHSTKSDILNYKPEAITQGRGSGDDTLRYLAEGILVGENALSRSERIISGDAPVQVRLEVDVYNFDPEAADYE